MAFTKQIDIKELWKIHYFIAIFTLQNGAKNVIHIVMGYNVGDVAFVYKGEKNCKYPIIKLLEVYQVLPI